MTFLFPAVAAFLGALSFLIDKSVMSIKRVTYKVYNGVSFPLISVMTLIVFFIVRPPITRDLFTGLPLLLLIILITLTIAVNLIYYRALKSDKLSEMETISLLNKIPLILFAGLFFPDERQPILMGLAIVAAISIAWSHWERHHIHFAKKTWPFLLWTLFVSPFSGILMKELLSYWHPISLLLVTHATISVILVALYHKNIKTTPKESIPYLLLTNLLATAAGILYLYSFQAQGIVYTVLVFSLLPVLVYLGSVIFLKEKLTLKKTISFIIILATVAAAQVLN